MAIGQRRSRVWKISTGDLRVLVATKDTVKGILVALGYRPHNLGPEYTRLYERLAFEGIDITPLQLRSAAAMRRRIFSLGKKARLSPDAVFKKDSPHGRNVLRRLLLEENPNPVCEGCGNGGSHNGNPLVLQIEHKNGKSNDHRRKNLCWLCPSCHSQTVTFAGRNSRKRPKRIVAPRTVKPRQLCGCGSLCWIGSKTLICDKCRLKRLHALPHPTKIVWPSPLVMSELVKTTPTRSIARELGVSDVAVAKFCKKHGIVRKTRGDWMKLGKLP